MSLDRSPGVSTCLATSQIQIVGLDTITAAGITPDDIREYGGLSNGQPTSPIKPTSNQEQQLNDAWTTCTRGQPLVTSWIKQLDTDVAPRPGDDIVWLSSSLAADDDQMYVGLSDGSLHTLASADGSPRWTFDARGGVQLTAEQLAGDGGFELYPTIADGTVYLGTNTGIVYALDSSSGAVRWTFDALTDTGYPLIVSGVVVVGDWTDTTSGGPGWTPTYVGHGPTRDVFETIPPARLHGLDPTTGAVIWSVTAPFINALTSADDNTLIYASANARTENDRQSQVSRVDPATGEPMWTINRSGTFRPAINDTNVYVLDDSATIVSALDADTGTTRWTTRTAAEIPVDSGYYPLDETYNAHEAAIVANDDTVAAVIGENAQVVGLDPTDGHVLWHHPSSYEGGFDVDAVGDDVVITPLNESFYVADPVTGDSTWYVDQSQLPTVGNDNPALLTLALDSAGRWVAAGGSWIGAFQPTR